MDLKSKLSAYSNTIVMGRINEMRTILGMVVHLTGTCMSWVEYNKSLHVLINLWRGYEVGTFLCIPPKSTSILVLKHTVFEYLCIRSIVHMHMT